MAGGADSLTGCSAGAPAAPAGWAEPARPPEGYWAPGGAFTGGVDGLAGAAHFAHETSPQPVSRVSSEVMVATPAEVSVC